jgi:iron complex transport system substrate-binding protein
MNRPLLSRLFWLSLVALLTASLLPHPAHARPQKVLSLNLCADQMLQSLADPQQILGVSPLARDPSLSFMAEQAHMLSMIAAKSEAILQAGPDLVLMAPDEHRLLREQLQQKGIEVFLMPAWTNLESGERQIKALAQRLDQPARGDRLIETIHQALEASRLKPLDTNRSVLEIERRLYTPGRTSLVSALLDEWHIPNLADRLHMQTGGFVALETLVLLKPDRLIISNGADNPKDTNDRELDDRGLAVLRHPALAQQSIKTIALPTRLTLCGGPATPALIAALSEALQ